MRDRIEGKERVIGRKGNTESKLYPHNRREASLATELILKRVVYNQRYTPENV